MNQAGDHYRWNFRPGARRQGIKNDDVRDEFLSYTNTLQVKKKVPCRTWAYLNFLRFASAIREA